MSAAVVIKPGATDEVRYLAPSSVFPDPEQPRLEPDDELAASIKENGVLEPIIVRPHPDPEFANAYMMVNGERRWRGTVRAKLASIPAILRLDLEERADRLIAQCVSNTGKPLTPLEQARAYREIMQEKGWSQAHLAEQIGVPRSTLGDHLRILDIPEVWQKELTRKGTRLQLSHVPLISPYRAVPEQYHAAAMKKTLEDSYGAARSGTEGPIPIGDFPRAIFEGFKPVLHPLWKEQYTSAGCAFTPERYTGPTVTVSRYGGDYDKPQKYAADPEQWRPLVAEAKKRQKAKAEKKQERAEQRKPWLELPEGHHKQLKGGGGYDTNPPTGWVEVVDPDGHWRTSGYGGDRAFDPDAFLQHVDPSKLALLDKGRWSGTAVATNDTAAHGRAREAWVNRWKSRREELIAQLALKLAEGRIQQTYPVSGAGVIYLLASAAGDRENTWRELLEVGEALALPLPVVAKVDAQNGMSAVQKWVRGMGLSLAERLAGGYAAALAMQLDSVWDTIQREQSTVLQSYERRTVNWKKIGTPAADLAAEPPDSAAPEVQTCRVCGCTEDQACEMEEGEPCHWVEPDLCSACAVVGEEELDEEGDVDDGIEELEEEEINA